MVWYLCRACATPCGHVRVCGGPHRRGSGGCNCRAHHSCARGCHTDNASGRSRISFADPARKTKALAWPLLGYDNVLCAGRTCGMRWGGVPSAPCCESRRYSDPEYTCQSTITSDHHHQQQKCEARGTLYLCLIHGKLKMREGDSLYEYRVFFVPVPGDQHSGAHVPLLALPRLAVS